MLWSLHPVTSSQRCWALLSILAHLLLMTSCLQLLSSLPQLLMLLPAYSEGFLWCPPSSPCTNAFWHNVLGTECCLQQIFTSPAVWVPIPQIYGSIRARDPSDLGAFHSTLQRGYLLLSSATIHTFLDTHKQLHQAENSVTCNLIYHTMMLVMSYF